MTERKPLRPTTKSQRRMLEVAVTRYQEAASHDLNFQMFVERRGLKETTLDMFRLGVVNHPIPDHERYVGRLVIPYLSKDGYPLTVRFRCLAEHDCKATGCRKYLTMKDDPARMFNVGDLFKADDAIHLTEGEIDAMVLRQAGYAAVALPGAEHWGYIHAINLAGFNRIYVWQDPDESGRDFTRDVCSSLSQAIPVTSKYDVNDLYLKEGHAGIGEAIHRAVMLHIEGEYE